MNKKSKALGLTKFPTGIAGIDLLTGGGLPAQRVTLALGGPGSGKTVFALQTLVNGARRGEPGIFVSFAEPPHHLVEHAESFGWDLAELEKDRLVFLDGRARPGIVKTGNYDLAGLLAGLRAVAAEIDARRIVFDSIDVLLLLLDDAAEPRELFRFRDWIFEHGFTALVTAGLPEIPAGSPPRQPLLHVIADCTLALELRLRDQVASRHLRILKYRGSAFLEHEVPLRIGNAGIEVTPPPASSSLSAPIPAAPLQPEIERARQQLSERVQEMDRFLEMKQAELAFLLEQRAARGEASESSRSKPGPRPSTRASGKPLSSS